MLWTAMILGLVSSLHCVGMCGPLQAVVMGSFGSNNSWKEIASYHLSRVFTYGILGLMAGVFGKAFGLDSWQQQSSILSGLFLLLALIFFYVLKFDKSLLKLLSPIMSKIRLGLQKNKTTRFTFFMGSGALNGILPCGMVYFALFAAIGTGQVWQSGLYMLVFGLGTIPLLFVTNKGSLALIGKKSSLIQKGTPWLVLVMAVLLILRGMNLGIPYLSPAASPQGPSTEICE